MLYLVPIIRDELAKSVIDRRGPKYIAFTDVMKTVTHIVLFMIQHIK